MAVKCPKHNAELEIEYTSINMLGNKYPVVTGQCPKCKIKYLSREIMSSSGSFKIGGQAYEYLNEMEMEYPHPFKSLSQTRQVCTASDATAIPDPSADREIESQKTPVSEKEYEAKREDARKSSLPKKEVSVKSKTVHVRKLLYLKKVPRFCLTDCRELVYADHAFVSVGNSSVETKGWYCKTCKTVYVSEEVQEITKEKMRQADMKRYPTNIDIPQMGAPLFAREGPINLAIPQNTLYVCKGLISCNRNGHNVESATGVLLAKNGAVIKINTNYCPQCRKYFISHDEYMRYRKLYGILLGNIKVTNGSFIGAETDLAEESILHMCGYSVNQTDNLSPAVRQGILQYLIDSKVSSKPEIIDYLNFFIRRNGKKQNMGEAVRRWSEDLKWVREYQINRQRHFEISNIQKNK